MDKNIKIQLNHDIIERIRRAKILEIFLIKDQAN